MISNEPLRIGIDGRCFLGKPTGVGRYVTELCRRLDALLPAATFFVYAPSLAPLPVESPRWIGRFDDCYPFRGMNKSTIWLQLRAHRLLGVDQLDAYWGSATLLPRLPRHTRAIVTAYDLKHIYRGSRKTLRRSYVLANRLLYHASIKRADSILSISEGTKHRLYQAYRATTAAVVTPAVTSHFCPQPEATVATCLMKYTLTPPYLLAVCTWEPGKNLELTVRAFLQMRSEGKLPNYSLALVGGHGWGDERLMRLVNDNQQSGIKALGWVPDEYLPALYTGAEAFLFPSNYEGYGIPALEARACGTRVITTDSPELRQAAGPNAIFIQPTLDQLKEGITNALARPRPEPPYRDELPTWDDGAEALAKALAGLPLASLAGAS